MKSTNSKMLEKNHTHSLMIEARNLGPVFTMSFLVREWLRTVGASGYATH